MPLSPPMSAAPTPPPPPPAPPPPPHPPVSAAPPPAPPPPPSPPYEPWAAMDPTKPQAIAKAAAAVEEAAKDLSVRWSLRCGLVAVRVAIDTVSPPPPSSQAAQKTLLDEVQLAINHLGIGMNAPEKRAAIDTALSKQIGGKSFGLYVAPGAGGREL